MLKKPKLNLQTHHWRSDDSSAFCPPRFLRDLRVLKTYGNYSTCDPHNMADWLVEVDPRFRQYTYDLVQSGVDRNNVQAVTDQQLQHDCHINNGVHRAKILSFSHRPAKPSLTDSQPAGPDVFISYRRTTGSQLARSELGLNRASKHILFMFISQTLHISPPPLYSSLLKVHLQVRGFSVFIDVEKLEAGKFEDKLIQSVQRARNFILVLSANALDKCMGDAATKDWVHKVRSLPLKRLIIDQSCKTFCLMPRSRVERFCILSI